LKGGGREKELSFVVNHEAIHGVDVVHVAWWWWRTYLDGLHEGNRNESQADVAEDDIYKEDKPANHTRGRHMTTERVISQMPPSDFSLSLCVWW
jgi:hypothetical protein